MDSKKAGYTEGAVSIVVNSILFGLKMWAGIVSGSVALVADAWHTISDSFSSLIVIAGTWLAGKKADRNHPFGHGRWEHVASLMIALLLGFIAFDIVRESIVRFSDRQSANFGTLAIVVTIISIIVKEALAQYAFILGRRSGNLTVKADGWHHRSDALSSVAVLAGILLRNFFWWIDSFLGLVISLMLFYAAYKISREAITKILGEKPDEDLIRQVREITESVSGENLAPHHFHIHNYVTQRELTFHIRMPGTRSIREGHDIAKEIENRIREELNVEATIHIDPLNSLLVSGAPPESEPPA